MKINKNNSRADIVILDPNHSPHSSSPDNTIIYDYNLTTWTYKIDLEQ